MFDDVIVLLFYCSYYFSTDVNDIILHMLVKVKIRQL